MGSNQKWQTNRIVTAETMNFPWMLTSPCTPGSENRRRKHVIRSSAGSRRQAMSHSPPSAFTCGTLCDKWQMKSKLCPGRKRSIDHLCQHSGTPAGGRYLHSHQSRALPSRPTLSTPAHLEPAKSAGSQPEMADAGSAYRSSDGRGPPL
jgi:hypothetical protein